MGGTGAPNATQPPPATAPRRSACQARQLLQQRVAQGENGARATEPARVPLVHTPQAHDERPLQAVRSGWGALSLTGDQPPDMPQLCCILNIGLSPTHDSLHDPPTGANWAAFSLAWFVEGEWDGAPAIHKWQVVRKLVMNARCQSAMLDIPPASVYKPFMHSQSEAWVRHQRLR